MRLSRTLRYYSNHYREVLFLRDFYKGYQTISLNEKEMAEFYKSNQLKNSTFLLENEFLLIANEQNNIVDKYLYQDGELKRVIHPTIDNNWYGKIKPRNLYQSLAISLLNDSSIPVKVLTGVYGSAKTFFMINAALQCLESGSKDKIVFVRNGLSPKGVPDIGHLPGTALDKTIVWAMPIADHIGGEEGLLRLLDARQLEILPLNYIRGRDLKNSIIFSDESENLTSKLIQLLLGRVGENSELWIAGDYRQSDLGKNFSEGLSYMIERLKGNRLFGYVDLPITERSNVAELSNLLDN